MKNLLLLIILAGISLSSCSKTAIGEIYADDSTDFSQYKTFNFAKMSVNNQLELEPKQVNIKRIQDAVRSELERRGLKEQVGGDMMVNLGIVMDVGETTRTTTLQDAPMYIGQRNYSWKSEEIVVNTYDRGTAVIDIIDSKQNKLVWQGSASKVIVDDVDKMGEKINDGITDLFKKFPVKPIGTE